MLCLNNADGPLCYYKTNDINEEGKIILFDFFKNFWYNNYRKRERDLGGINNGYSNFSSC